MYLKHKQSENLVEQARVAGRYHAGEELQDPENFSKSDLVFPSGEPLPVCWQDPDYKLLQ
ncbi:MAG: acetyltransferase [Gammaproteobacteria bacterium SG8_15]|nr:MAG: acetyltransferase [Gammaproteobacteria bacterium SG8_15]